MEETNTNENERLRLRSRLPSYCVANEQGGKAVYHPHPF
jgi:hypothetical protein